MARRPMVTTADVADTYTATTDMHSSIATEDIEIAVVTGEDIHSKNVQDSIKSEAFYRENVVFTVARGSKEDSPYVELGVNGEKLIVERGVPTIGKRKFLNCLFTTQNDIKTEQYVDKRDGSEQTMIRKYVSPAYGVTLIKDTEDGRKWFEAMQAAYYI